MPIKEWIKQEDVSELDLLSILHVTKWSSFEKILKVKTLKKDVHNDFVRQLGARWQVVYLYYGFPYYLPYVDDMMTCSSDIDDMNVGIILKKGTLNSISCCYPFETGAYFNKLYSDSFDISKEDLENYELDIVDEKSVKKVIKRYFTTNKNYRRGKTDFTDSYKHPKEEKLVNLYNKKGVARSDRRATAIELQAFENLDISDLIEAVILPKNKSAEFPEIKEELLVTFPSLVILEYDEITRFGPFEGRDYLWNETLDFYKQKGVLL